MQVYQIFNFFIGIELIWVLSIGIPITLPGKLLPMVWHPYLVVALFLFWPLQWLNRHWLGTRQRNSTLRVASTPCYPLVVPLFLILIWLPINLGASAFRSTSWVATGYLLWGIALYLTIISWPSAQSYPQRIAYFLLVCGVVLAIVSPPLTAWKPEFRLFHLPLYDKLTSLPLDLGETIHANVLAGALVIILPLLLALALQKSHRLVFILLLPFVASILVLTQSRGGYLAVAVALPVVIILHWPRLLYTILPIMIIVILLIQQFSVQSVLNQLSSDSSLGGWDGRLDIWIQSAHALYDFSFTGIGIGTFTLVIPLLYPLRVNIEGYPHAHNLFLQIGLDLGLPGLIAYLALLINLFIMVAATLCARRISVIHRTLAIGSTGSLIAMLIHGLLDAVTWGTKLAFMPWLLFALITLLFLHTQRTQTLAKV